MKSTRPVFGPLQYSIIVLTLLTALLHLALGIGFFQDTLGKLFVLNGLGYVALLAGALPKIRSARICHYLTQNSPISRLIGASLHAKKALVVGY